MMPWNRHSSTWEVKWEDRWENKSDMGMIGGAGICLAFWFSVGYLLFRFI